MPTVSKDKETIFVFGSNLAGRHGKGSALHALRKYGAVYGVGHGIQGQSYAVPTKDENLRVLPLSEIRKYVEEFIEFAASRPTWDFYVVPIGCGLAGYQPSQIGPMFEESPENVSLPDCFQPFLDRNFAT